MLETLSKGFKTARNRLKGFQEITERNVDDAVREIRLSLLEADVEYNVVKRFLERVKTKALGEIVQVKAEAKAQKTVSRVKPGDHFISICQDELEALMGPVDTSIERNDRGFATIMMVGLQGSGKTTTCGKLCYRLKEDGHKPFLVAADVYRPAAINQLKVLGERLDVPVFHEAGVAPPELATRGMSMAVQQGYDTVIIDTAGRLAVDDVLMNELEKMQRATQSRNILLVVDAMIGQDAVRTASEFDRRLSLDGFVMTKLDGDARGGAALSIKEVTGKPIKFLGMGEGMDRLEEFRPEGLASRILGMGDVVGLMSDFERVVDAEKAEADAEKMLKGDFNFYQFLEQIQVIKKMGSLKDLVEKMPFFGANLPANMNFDDQEIVRIEAMINSMTRDERTNPDLVQAPTRLARIATGSGTTPSQVENLLGRFRMMKNTFEQIGKTPGLLGKIPGFKQMMQSKAMKDVDMDAMMADMMPEGAGAEKKKTGQARKVDRTKAKKKRQDAKKARKKGRKR